MSASDDIVIVSGTRTAVGRFGGGFKDLPAPRLGAVAIKEAIRRAKLEPRDVDHVVMGCTLQIADTINVARQAAIYAGVPVEVPAFTVNRLCGSGVEAIHSAARMVATGDAEVVVAGGVENMSRMPYILRNARWGYRMGDGVLEDSMAAGVLQCPINDYHMGVTAENVATKYGVNREDQDKFALESQKRAVAAIKGGLFKEQIVPVHIPQSKGEAVTVDTDEHPRADTTLEKLAKLTPAFKQGGTVTAGNSSGLNDGAAAVVVMSRRTAQEKGLEPLLTLRGRAVAGVDPAYMGIGPAQAVPRAMKRAGLRVQDMDLIELNEAFAAQAVAVMRELNMDSARTNVNGGAIALGHPLGATGAVLVVKLMYEMARRHSRYGLVTACIGGGMGIASIFERA
ncbi:MAG: acetyl-CoA C-acetyltransferase [Dehalococcoidia bacterium]|nr:acetyl-CoA C-acetyltransferase [Dehalococcoidia bacterium]